MFNTIRFLAVLALFAGGVQFLAADESRPDAAKSAVSAEETSISAKQTDRADLLKAIEKSWIAREQQAARLVVKWKEHRTFFPGAFQNFNGGAAYPEQKTSLEVTCSCTLNHDDFRLEEKGQQYEGRSHKFTPMNRIVSYHRSLDRTYYGVELPEDQDTFELDDCPVGFIKTREQSSEFNNPVLYPVVLHFRPVSKQFRRFNLKEAQVLNRSGMIGDTECVLLTPKNSDSPYYYEYWLDSELQYAVRRVIVKTMGALGLKIDLEYHKNQEGYVVPARWTTRSFRGEEAQKSQSEAEVLTVEFPQHLDGSATMFEFPPGTFIEDRDTDKARLGAP